MPYTDVELLLCWQTACSAGLVNQLPPQCTYTVPGTLTSVGDLVEEVEEFEPL